MTVINTKAFFDCLIDNGLDFFTGVPDSLLKELCACIGENCDKTHNIIAANEGNAVGIACGYHLATGGFGVVYMQNSGIGNAVNPLISLADEEVYKIPLLMLVGWRGAPDTADEPQHKKQGKITLAMFETLGIEAVILDDGYEETIRYCVDYMSKRGRPVALIVRKDTFGSYEGSPKPADCPLTRERAIEVITEYLGTEDIVVSTTGKASRELFALRERSGFGHANDFLTVGSMGHTSSIALGISLFTDKRVYCIDGDGSFLMHMGAAAVNASSMGENFRYIIINNGAHESVGGQPTVGFEMDIPEVLSACGFAHVCSAADEEGVKRGMEYLRTHTRTAMVIRVRQGARDDLGRPDLPPQENKRILMERLVK